MPSKQKTFNCDRLLTTGQQSMALLVALDLAT